MLEKKFLTKCFNLTPFENPWVVVALGVTNRRKERKTYVSNIEYSITFVSALPNIVLFP